jgi:ATP-dependent RNA helicase DeaD
MQDTESLKPISNFASLRHPKIEESLRTLGITTPTPVQSRAIPSILNGGDHIVEAQTGSGKTLAFALPILLQLLSSSSPKGTQCLIISPTRELATQISSVIGQITTDIVPAVIIGGERQEKQIRQLKRDSRLIIGTPGRILDLIQQRIIVLRKCKSFVLDEADEMLSMGFIEEVRAILSRLPSDRQGLFFSATITPRVLSLASSFLKTPTTIEIEKKVENAPLIEHLFYRVDGALTAKVDALSRYLEKHKPFSTLVFCNTKSDTELVEILLKKRGFAPRRINSDLSQKERDKTMSEFRSGDCRLLIATDVAARGIDISDVELVVNYSVHDTVETYVHRTGRTGRAGKSGTALSLVGPQDFTTFYSLSKTLGATLSELTSLDS